MVALLLVTLLAQGTPRDPPSPSAAATLSGRVSEAGSGRPLPRIVVSLDAPPAPRVETLTDADGRYVFNDLPAGRYVLTAAPERHRSSHLAQRFGETEPLLYISSASRPTLELKAGERRSHADFALARALGIEGRVLDPSDQPIANVPVEIRRADGRFVPVRNAVTNDLGQYRLYGLAAGRYRICALIENELAVVGADGGKLTRTCHMAATAEAEASEVVLSTEDAMAIDIRIQRMGSFVITGTVVDAAGIALDNGFVRAFPKDESGSHISTRTEKGQFTLKGASSGRYLLTASVGGGMPGDPEPPARAREVGYAVVDVQGGNATGVSIALSKPVSLAGAVTFEGQDAPSPRQLTLVVYADPSEEQWWRTEAAPSRAAVGDDLRFELKDLYRRPRLVSVSNMPDGWALKTVRLDKRDITFIPTDLTVGSRLEILLTNAVAKPSARVDIPAGTSTPFHVIVLPVDPARWRGRRMIDGQSARDGALRLGALLPGDYLVAAIPLEDALTVARDADRLADLASVASRVTFASGDVRTIDLSLVSLPPKR